MIERKRFTLATVALTAALALAACGGGSKNADPKKSTTTASATTTTAKTPPIAPLTGLPDPSGAALGRASLAVKIENTPEARPQSGLDVADIVYEEVVDGGITRFIAVFNSNAPDSVGPVRSVRPMDPQVLRPLGGIFMLSGGTPKNLAAAQAGPFLVLTENNQDVMFRLKSRPAPHNLYAYPAKAWSKGGKPIPPPAMFTYRAANAPFPGEGVDSFTVNFIPRAGYAASFSWNAFTQSWDRSMGGVPFNAASGKRVSPKNVIVQFLQWQGQPGAFDAEGVVSGSGDAWIFSAGKLVKGRWSHSDPNQPTTYTDAAGAPLSLTPGQTWVSFAPVGSVVDVRAPAATTAAPATTATRAPATTAKKK
ncbi:MAG: hypothetical protein JWL73_3027 [Actinomycetia bacterium]|nr:hypothetical protein [Actinomycetes bacterium]